MLKGVNKKVVEIANIENEYFEKAILFIKAENQEKDINKIKSKAGEYIGTINYVPRRKFSPVHFALGALKLAAAAAAGALLTNFIY